MAGDVDALEICSEQTAFPRTTNQSCGNDGPTDVPNNVYGWGRIELVWPLPEECLPTLIFADGFES